MTSWSKVSEFEWLTQVTLAVFLQALQRIAPMGTEGLEHGVKGNRKAWELMLEHLCRYRSPESSIIPLCSAPKVNARIWHIADLAAQGLSSEMVEEGLRDRCIEIGFRPKQFQHLDPLEQVRLQLSALEGTEEKRQMLISKGWTGHLWPRVPDGQHHRWWYFSEEDCSVFLTERELSELLHAFDLAVLVVELSPDFNAALYTGDHSELAVAAGLVEARQGATCTGRDFGSYLQLSLQLQPQACCSVVCCSLEAARDCHLVEGLAVAAVCSYYESRFMGVGVAPRTS
eukprot:s2706_g5.t1